jgi:hypothetical protein
MNPKQFACTLLTACLVGMILTGCDSEETDEEAPGTVTFLFNYVVDGEPLVLEEGRYVNAARNPYEVTRFEYIMSDFTLNMLSGDPMLVHTTHYGNAVDASTQMFTATVPPGNYTSTTFTFGLVKERNKPSALPSSEVFNNMIWPGQLGGGYHYMRIEGRKYSTEEPSTFLVHTGPTGEADNSVTLTKVTAFTVNGDDWVIEITMDLNQWFERPNVYDFNDHPGSIMPDQGAQRLLSENGHSVFTLSVSSR